MRILRVGFSKPKSKLAIGSFLIRVAENCDFSHAFLRWTSNSIDRDLVYQASRGMVHFVSGAKFDTLAETVRMYEIELTDQQFSEITTKCIDLAGTKYGFFQLVGMGLERLTGVKNPFRDGDKTLVCSELVGEVLRQLYNMDLDLEYAGPKELEYLISKYSGFTRVV